MKLQSTVIVGLLALGLIGLGGCNWTQVQDLTEDLQRIDRPARYGDEAVRVEAEEDSVGAAGNSQPVASSETILPRPDEIAKKASSVLPVPGGIATSTPLKDAADKGVSLESSDATTKTGLTEPEPEATPAEEEPVTYTIEDTATEFAAPYVPPPPTYTATPSGYAVEYQAPKTEPHPTITWQATDAVAVWDGGDK